MHYEKYLEYIIYGVGTLSVLYIFLIVFRHVLLFYILKALQKITASLPKFTHKQPKADATNREDALKRDQEAEIFKQQVSEIKASINKKKSGNAIDVNVQRVSKTSQGSDDAFAGSDSRLEMGQEIERIVGVAKPIGKWTSLVLGKKMSQIASIMQHQQNMKGQQGGYWTSYIKARNAASGQELQQRRA